MHELGPLVHQINKVVIKLRYFLMKGIVQYLTLDFLISKSMWVIYSLVMRAYVHHIVCQAKSAQNTELTTLQTI